MATGRRGIVSGLLGLQAELERMIDNAVGRGERTGSSNAWAPPADVFVAAGHVVVRFEVAGVRLENIDLTYSEGELRVRGMRLESAGEPKDGYWQMEIPHGPFERVVKIPMPVDGDAIDATCRDGILEVRMPVVAEKRPVNRARIEADA